MAMSTLELTSRANFLIYNYVKKQLHNDTLAENFRKAVQDNSQKDIIIFKGLENLLTVLKNYYSMLGTASSDFASPTKDETPDAAVVVKKEPGIAAPVEPDSALANGQKKKKKKQRKSGQEQQPSDSIPADPEPLAEFQQPDADAVTLDDSEQQKSKRKKKRRQLEAQEQPGEENHSEPVVKQEEQVEAEAVDAEAETDVPKPKKRKKDRRNTEDAAGAVTKSDAEELNNGHGENGNKADEDAEQDGVAANSKGGKNKRHNQPFRRVREEEVVNKHFHDNSFDAKPGSSTGWGYKANEDLKPTQGRSFRHEKTKKKRGSYKGGAIDTGVSSFKFESDSE